jgi:isopentenyldiphosphate isomerase
VKQFPASQETDQEFVWLYQAVHSGPFQPDPHEVASLDWFFPAQIDQMLRDQPSTFSSCLRLLWNQRPR